MFLGEHRQSVSSTGRFKLPQQALTHLDGGLVITRGFDQNLILFPKDGWQELAGTLLDKPITNHDVRALRRRLFSAAVELSPDENGQITLPDSLRSFAGINGEVVLAGMYNYIELWSADRWQPVRDAAESADNGDRWNRIGI